MPRNWRTVPGLLIGVVVLWVICWQLQGPLRGTATCCIISYLLLAAQAAIYPGWLATAADGVGEDGTTGWSRLGRVLTIVGMHVGIVLGALDVYGGRHVGLGAFFPMVGADLQLVDVGHGIRQFVGHALTGTAIGGLIALLAGSTLGRSFAIVLGGSIGWFLGIAVCFLSRDAQSPTVTWIALAWLILGVLLGCLWGNRIAGFGRLARRWAGIVSLPAFAVASWKWAILSQHFAFDPSRVPTLTMFQRLEIAWRWNGGALTFVLLSSGVLAGGLGALVASEVFRRRTGVAADRVCARRRLWPVAWAMAGILLAVSATRLWHERLQELELVATLPENQFGFRTGPEGNCVVALSYRDVWRQDLHGSYQQTGAGKAVFGITRALGSQPPAEIVVSVGAGGVYESSGAGDGFVISRDGRRLAWVVTTRSEIRDAQGRRFSTTSKIGVGDLDTATVLAEVEMSGSAEFLTLSPKGDRVAIWLAGEWVVYDTDGLREIARWDAGNQSNYSFKQVPFPGAFSPDGGLFAHLVFDHEGSDAPWRLDVRKVGAGEPASARLQPGRWIAVAFQDSSKVILAGEKRCLAWRVDPDDRLELTHSLAWGPFQFTCSALSLDGRVVIGRGIVPGHSYQQFAGHLLRLPDGAFLGRIPQRPDPHFGCSLSPDGTCFVQKSYSDELKVWRMTARQLRGLEQDDRARER